MGLLVEVREEICWDIFFKLKGLFWEEFIKFFDIVSGLMKKWDELEGKECYGILKFFFYFKK